MYGKYDNYYFNKLKKIIINGNYLTCFEGDAMLQRVDYFSSAAIALRLGGKILTAKAQSSPHRSSAILNDI